MKNRIHVEWLPYMIDPSTHKNGERYKAYNERRWGGDEWTRGLRRNAASVGLVFRDWRWWPNSTSAHQLMEASKNLLGHDAAHELKGVLFRKLYEEGVNISEAPPLLDAAVEIGLTLEQARAALGSDDMVKAVRDSDRNSKRDGVTGVPFTIVEAGALHSDDRKKRKRHRALSGAQSTDAILEAIHYALQGA